MIEELKDAKQIAAGLTKAMDLLNDIRPDLANISRAAEDEGDRVYFGSTNDADLLEEIWRRVEDFLLRAELEASDADR